MLVFAVSMLSIPDMSPMLPISSRTHCWSDGGGGVGKAGYVGKTLLAKSAAGFVAEWTVGVRGGLGNIYKTAHIINITIYNTFVLQNGGKETIGERVILR